MASSARILPLPDPVSKYPQAPRQGGALDLMGIPVHPVGPPEILGFMGSVIAERTQAVILHVNVNGANLAIRHPSLMKAFNQTQMVFCDGDGIRWGLSILGYDPPPKTTYNVWLWTLAQWCVDRDASLYLLGAVPGVADQAAKNLVARLPRLRIAGTHHGFFPREGPENEAVLAMINEARPDVLLVCFGMPMQEHWVMANRERLATHVLLTGGASLDYAAGIARMTPRWMVRMQLEWLYRLLQEPIRLFGRYVIGNPVFMARVFLSRLRR
jgi:N-acetylglucosaminyldiphosphoundecaprenol N-acetyl-beta-D-mannosaminyltransferase